ncbi:MAG: hypothetical protein S4CHLAM2_09710 [Chlamydiales bacterium]|nr:hypothetical protein [Chlamydiales bacterium]
MENEKLLHLLRKKKGFFETILDLTEEEQELPVSEWISVLEQKKILLSCIDEIDSELKPFQSALQHLSQEISEELESIRKVIRTILHLDTKNQNKRKQELKLDAGKRD